MQELFVTLFALFVTAIFFKFVPSKYFQPRDYRLEVVKGWAEKLGYEIVIAERRYFVSMPFVWIASTHSIYYIELIDATGGKRKGYIRFRHRWYGKIDTNSLQVRWL